MGELGLPEPPVEPEGSYLDFEDPAAMAQRFPKLWDRFG
jgi:hypothetical protein